MIVPSYPPTIPALWQFGKYLAPPQWAAGWLINNIWGQTPVILVLALECVILSAIWRGSIQAIGGEVPPLTPPFIVPPDPFKHIK